MVRKRITLPVLVAAVGFPFLLLIGPMTQSVCPVARPSLSTAAAPSPTSGGGGDYGEATCFLAAAANTLVLSVLAGIMLIFGSCYYWLGDDYEEAGSRPAARPGTSPCIPDGDDNKSGAGGNN